MFDQGLGAHRGFEHLLQVVLDFRGRWIPKRKLDVPDDWRENVVEVMSDATGQVPDCLHLLGVTQLRLQTLPLLGRALALRDVAYEDGVQHPIADTRLGELHFGGEHGAVAPTTGHLQHRASDIRAGLK